jgi:O-antigen ligase
LAILGFATSPRSFAIYGMGVTALLILALGSTKGLAIVIGAIIACVAIAHPMAGLIVVIFANTSFQVLGSSHIIGAPASLSKMFGAITITSLLFHVLFARWKITASPMYMMMFLFFFSVFVWDFIQRNPETGPFEGTIRYVMMVLLATTVATFGGQSQKALDHTLLAMYAAIALTGVIGLAEHFVPALAIPSDDPRLALGAIGAVVDNESLSGVTIKRITGGIGDANWLAYTLAMAIPLLIYMWHRFEGPLMRVLTMGFAGLMLIALVLSYTRTGFLGLAVGMLYLAIRRVIPFKPFIAAAFMGLAVTMIYLPPGFMDRMFSKQYLKEGSTPIRKLYFTKAIEIWQENPIAGRGYKGFGINFYERLLDDLPDDHRLQSMADAMERAVVDGRELVSNIGTHNLELEILVEYGLFGAFAYFGLFILTIREMLRIEARGPPHLRILAICITASLLAFLTCGLFGHAKYLKFLWLTYGLAMAAARVSAIGDSPTRSLLQVSRYNG